jgi:phosphomevalonate kinase
MNKYTQALRTLEQADSSIKQNALSLKEFKAEVDSLSTGAEIVFPLMRKAADIIATATAGYLTTKKTKDLNTVITSALWLGASSTGAMAYDELGVILDELEEIISRAIAINAEDAMDIILLNTGGEDVTASH